MLQKRFAGWTAVICSFLSTCIPIQGQDLDPLKQLVRQTSLYPIRRIVLSPTGLQLAYVVQRPSDDRTRNQEEIRIADLSLNKRHTVCCQENDAVNPSWSPDGRSLAFVSINAEADSSAVDVGTLSVYTSQSGAIRSFPVSTSTSFQLFPRWLDDEHVLFFAPSRQEIDGIPQPRAATADGIRVFISPSSSLTSLFRPASGIWRDIARNPNETVSILDVKTGRTRTVVSGTPIRWPELSPNGQYLAYGEYEESATTEFVGSYAVHVINLLDDEDVQLKKRAILYSGFDHPFTWSPDSKGLAFPTLDQMSMVGALSYTVVSGVRWAHTLSLAGQQVPGSGSLRAVVWSGGADYITAAMGSKFVTWKTTDGSLVNQSAVTGGYIQQLALTLGPEDRAIAVVETMPEHGMEVVGYKPQSGKVDVLAVVKEEPLPHWGSALLTVDRQKLLFGGWTLNHFSEIQSLDWNGNIAELTDGDNRPKEMFAKYQDVTWRNANGQYLDGALILPPSYRSDEGTARLPLVVRVYPSDHASGGPNIYGLYGDRDAHSLDLMLAADGFAVFYPNCPTRADAFAADIANDVLPGIQHLVDSGIVDPERLALLGHSDGVEAALNLLTSSMEFKASVLFDGFADFLTIYGDISGYGVQAAQGVHSMGPPWEMPQRYIENSPVFRLDRVNAPILLFHGTADSAVPLFAGEEVFADLRTLGKTATLVEYQDGGHVLSQWTLAQQIDAARRTLEWFNRYLMSRRTN